MFKLSTKERYALRAMIELAVREGHGYVPLAELAKAQGISPKYLEQLAIPLRNAGLVRSERGPNGGYELARLAHEITALDIVSAIAGPLDLLNCIESADACERSQTCAARKLWKKLSESIAAVLAESTLAELRNDQQTACAASALSYSI